MNKPAGYDDVKVSNRSYERLAPGGHRCVLLKVIETKSKTGLDMLEIHFDTADDDAQPKHFSNIYNGETWFGRTWLVVDQNARDKSGRLYGKENLKQFNTAVKDSNDGFEVVWGKTYGECFKGRRVGIVFGEEEYLQADHQVRISVKANYFRKIDGVENAEIPKFKALPKPVPAEGPSGNEGFMQVSQDALEDEGLPFI